ncbi:MULTISPECIES: ABC transporter permease [Caldilinea]|uniref:Putative sugar ABC transporter permease protein n=1 Tax=Caldilinea aerophila (strain DSM 14535 / JCM 11387 / NBRC 104270 / STL-6-O1) TaxID=926550 RepID=I0I7U0_CALAS|nr:MULTISPECIES: ABC transporter permease [Caldilinea]BAM01328.1 putative sugar ABC transporter permease protein [Caldilinea aerophila DSM 14535 = NBRC 104270]
MSSTLTQPRFGLETLRRWAVQMGALLALLLLVGYLALATPHFLTPGNIANVARQTAVTTILAAGQTFVILCGGIDLSVAATAGLSASVAAVLMTSQVWILGIPIGPVPFGVGMVIALLVGLLVGLLNGLIITKGRIPDFIATLGTLTTMRGIALLVTGGLPVPSHLTAIELRGYLPPELIWMGAGDVAGIPVAGLIALGVIVLGWLLLRYTAFGRAIYAVGGNREAARVSGINIDRTKIMVYMLSGLLAALAGMVLTGRLNSANALMGEGEELRSIAATVIGGANLFGGQGSLLGTLIGALVIGVLGNGLNLLNVSAFWQRVIQGLVIIGVVLFDQWRRRRFGA